MLETISAQPTATLALIPIMVFILIIIVSILAIGLVKPQVVCIPLIAIIVIMVTLPGIFI